MLDVAQPLPLPQNEPVLSYAPGSPERAALKSALKSLAAERKPLLDEAEFYVGRELPAKLRGQLDANDAAVEAQRTLVVNQQAEIVRINKLYDVELERLKHLWAGAQPGSMGSLPAVPPVRPASAPGGRAAASSIRAAKPQ